MKKETSPPQAKAKSRQEIALEYGWHRNTFNRRLQQLGIKLPRGLISPADQEQIYEVLGRPNKSIVDHEK
jgi:hypothetical protein